MCAVDKAMQGKASRAVRGLAVLLVCAALLLSLPVAPARAAGTVSVNNETDLRSAVNGTADVIQITGKIVLTGTQITINRSLTIQGNGFELQVEKPGLDEAGTISSSASAYRVFEITGGNVVINDLTMYGGRVQGGALSISSGATVSLNRVSMLRSGGGTSYPGGGIYNSGNLYIRDSVINRNAAVYGGGFLNSGYMVVENTSFSENRSLGGSGGGGAGENKGTLYINNSTFSNNKSTELGGAINDSGYCYIMNTTFTGNVTYHDMTYGGYCGGAVKGRGSVIVNSLLAYNYHLFNEICVLNDYSDTVHGNMLAGRNRVVNSILHGGLTDGYRNQLYDGDFEGKSDVFFSNGVLTRVLDASGNLTGKREAFQPYLYTAPRAYSSMVPLQEPIDDRINQGARTLFNPYNTTDPLFAYYNEEDECWYRIAKGSYAWTAFTPTSADLSYEVKTDQNGNTRGSVIGACATSESQLYMVRLIHESANDYGLVHGVTVYGDVYRKNETATIICKPDENRYFSNWTRIQKDGSYAVFSYANPYTFSVTDNIDLYPVYSDEAPTLTQTTLVATITPEEIDLGTGVTT